jgi:LmbE family N-acetylglucosaminyl deacetylase
MEMTNTLLVIGAHSDDPAQWGGAMCKYKRKGWKVIVYSCCKTGTSDLASYRPYVDEAIEVKDPILIHSKDVENGIIAVIRKYRPKIIITHNKATWEEDHKYVAEVVPFAVTRVFYEEAMRNELQIWGGDAEWEGPIANNPTIFVKITEEDLKVKDKMMSGSLRPVDDWGIEYDDCTSHYRNWDRLLCKWRAHTIFRENELYEAYVSWRPITIIE